MSKTKKTVRSKRSISRKASPSSIPPADVIIGDEEQHEVPLSTIPRLFRDAEVAFQLDKAHRAKKSMVLIARMEGGKVHLYRKGFSFPLGEMVTLAALVERDLINAARQEALDQAG